MAHFKVSSQRNCKKKRIKQQNCRPLSREWTREIELLSTGILTPVEYTEGKGSVTGNQRVLHNPITESKVKTFGINLSFIHLYNHFKTLI